MTQDPREKIKEALPCTMEDLVFARLAAEHMRKTGGDKGKEVAEISDRVADAVEDSIEMNHIFDLRHKADMRGIKMWQEKTGKNLTWPDHADIVVFLLEKIDALASQAATKPDPKKVENLEWALDELKFHEADLRQKNDKHGAKAFPILYRAAKAYLALTRKENGE